MQLEMQGKESLVYYTVSGDPGYLDLLDLSIRSLREWGKFYGDVLVICDEGIEEAARKRFCSATHGRLLYMRVGQSNSSDSSANKLRIYEFESILDYWSCLFLDSDILIANDLTPCLSLIGESDAFLVSTEDGFFSRWNSITGDGHAGPLLSAEEREAYRETRSICAGCFAFPVADWSLELLRGVMEHYSSSERLCYYEQHHFNYGLLRSGRWNWGLQDFITHQGHLDLPERAIVHYPGNIGNSSAKSSLMSRDFEVLRSRRGFYLGALRAPSTPSVTVSYREDENRVFMEFHRDVESPRMVIFDVSVSNEPFLIYQGVQDRAYAGQIIWVVPGQNLRGRVFRVDVHDAMDLRVASSCLSGEGKELVSCRYDETDDTIKCQSTWRCHATVSIGEPGAGAFYSTETLFEPGVTYWYSTTPALSVFGRFWIGVTETTSGARLCHHELGTGA